MNSWAMDSGRFDHFSFAGVGLPKKNVITRRAMKQEDILQHNADLLAQRR